MKAEFINPFVTSTINVFSTMLACDLERGPLETGTSFTPRHEVSGIIGMSGDAAGTVIVSVCQEVA